MKIVLSSFLELLFVVVDVDWVAFMSIVGIEDISRVLLGLRVG